MAVTPLKELDKCWNEETDRVLFRAWKRHRPNPISMACLLIELMEDSKVRQIVTRLGYEPKKLTTGIHDLCPMANQGDIHDFPPPVVPLKVVNAIMRARKAALVCGHQAFRPVDLFVGCLLKGGSPSSNRVIRLLRIGSGDHLLDTHRSLFGGRPRVRIRLVDEEEL